MPQRLRRYSAFYFWYYAGLGAFSPYIGRFVDSLGHSGYVLGLMLALWYGTRVLAPPAWTAIVARGERPGAWLVLGSALALLTVAGFTTFHGALGLCVVMALFGLAVNPLLPQFEAMTLSALLHRDARPPRDEHAHAEGASLLRRPGIRRFLLVALLMQTGFGAFYVFYTLHLQAAGHGGLAIGLLWGTGVVSEIAMFWVMPRLFARFGAPALLSLCLAITVLRWIATALYPGELALMFAVQGLHAFSFAVFHACCMRQMAESFPGRDAAAGQSLLYSVSSGVGGVLGALLASALWEWRGGDAAFLGAALTVALAWLTYARRPRALTSPVAG